jgi:L-fucose isomerase-like protein
MGFMSLRDEGVAAGCEADLDATLTMMILQELFGKPGFQHNPVVDTEKNQYFGAHCTSASKLHGVNTPSLPYILRSHNEAGWGCVPQVLMTAGQEFTMARYLPGDAPRMLVYGGTIVGCRPKSRSGCRTNVETVINEVADACDVQGHHLTLIFGNHARRLRAFCQLHGIEAAV